jgi:hypothetical protein
MSPYLYLYDCKHARSSNARRVSFTKELFGYTYSWKTKRGIQYKRKPGLLDECVGAKSVLDSAILVPEYCRGSFDVLFNSYNDILTVKVYEVLSEMT